MQGVRREVFEETGLYVVTEGIAEVFERIMPDIEGRAEYHYVLIDYFCRITAGQPVRAMTAALSNGLRYRNCGPASNRGNARSYREGL